MKDINASIIFPFHDPNAQVFPYLGKITPQLKSLFSQAFLSISPVTEKKQIEWIQYLQQDPFFIINFNQPGSLAGDHFLAAYRNAVVHTKPSHILHLCVPDAVAFFLLNANQNQFIEDIGWVNNFTASTGRPVLFQRSESAWATYPDYYREVEHLVIRAGEIIFGKHYDFAWSHMVIQSQRLRDILPLIKSHDFGLLMEFVLLLKDDLYTKDVDWQEWEDPFILGKDSQQLRLERNTPTEFAKRLQWALPLLQILLNYVKESKETKTLNR